MFENFQWDVDVPTKNLSFTAVVGQLETAPGIIYKVSRVMDRENGENIYLYIVDSEAYGCAVRNKRFETPEVIMEYLSGQFDKIAQFGELKDKRDKIIERLRPLNKKIERTSSEIFDLLKSAK